jgi:4-amino-4-deoxy-L-arabinose transferase-like glycosyltransferase
MGFTGNDWLGFYDEAQFFSSTTTTTTNVGFMLYRTPLYYIVNGFFLRVFGDSLWVFQIGNSILSAPFFLSLYLLSKKLLGTKIPEHSKIGLITVLFIFFNPFFFKNITYLHSKILATYFIIMSIYFYLRLRESRFNQKNKNQFLLWGVFTGAAYISHQLALIYIVGMVIDYLILIRCKIIRLTIKTAAISIIPLIATIVSWYLWVIGEYGLKTVLSFNPPVFRTTFSFWVYSRLQDIFTSFVPVELIYYIYAAVSGIFRSFDKLFDSAMSFYVHTDDGKTIK